MSQVFRTQRELRRALHEVFDGLTGQRVLVWMRESCKMGTPLPFGEGPMNRVAGMQELVQQIQGVMSLTDAECLTTDARHTSAPPEEIE